jgi:hypothetical protein
MHFDLVPHPTTPAASPTFKVWATVELSASFAMMATANIWFAVGAPSSRFVMPEAEQPNRADGLWKSTCCEAFLRESGRTAYREWNFAPSGQWAAYDFASYRNGMSHAEVDAPPYVRVEDNLTWWTLGATIAVESGKSWEMNLTTVLEEQDGTKSYWALAHPAEKPDFHAPDCFIGKLA